MVWPDELTTSGGVVCLPLRLLPLLLSGPGVGLADPGNMGLRPGPIGSPGSALEGDYLVQGEFDLGLLLELSLREASEQGQ